MLGPWRPGPLEGQCAAVVPGNDDDEDTTVRAVELEPPPRTVSKRRYDPSQVGPQGTVRLRNPQLPPEPCEQTVLLPEPRRPQPAAPGPAGGGDGTVVLPRRGRSVPDVEQTELIAMDELHDPRPTAPRTNTPLAVAPAASAGLAPLRATPPTTARSAAPPTGGHPVVGPTGGHPVVPPTGGHPVVPPTGGHPVVPVARRGPVGTPTGGVPIVPRARPRGRGRPMPRPVPPTGAHPVVPPDDGTRLAWGFLIGVLLTVGIAAVAVMLALALLG